MHDFAPRFAPLELRRRWIADGLWNDDTLATVVADGAARHATTRARVLSHTRPYDGTVRDLADQGARLAGLLAQHGIGTGDVVAFQLPNWPEAIASMYGLLRVARSRCRSCTSTGITRSATSCASRGRALITADHFGEHDYLGELAELDGTLPDLELVIVVDAHGAVPRVGPASLTWAEAMAAGDPIAEPAVLDPDSPAVVQLHVGNHLRREGRRAQPPDVPRRAAPGRRGAARDPGLVRLGGDAGTHRPGADRPHGGHAERARTDRRGSHPPHPRPLGPRAGPAHHDDRGPGAGQRRDRLPHLAARTPRLRRRRPRCRSWPAWGSAGRRSRPRWPGGRRSSASRSCAGTAPPSTPRSR